MDPNDRLFGEIAIRLQLLTREQVNACVQAQGGGQGARRIGEVACELGYISAGEAEMVLKHQRRIQERRRQSRDDTGRPTTEVGVPSGSTAQQRSASTRTWTATSNAQPGPAQPAAASRSPKQRPSSETLLQGSTGPATTGGDRAGGAARWQAPRAQPPPAARAPAAGLGPDAPFGGASRAGARASMNAAGSTMVGTGASLPLAPTHQAMAAVNPEMPAPAPGQSAEFPLEAPSSVSPTGATMVGPAVMPGAFAPQEPAPTSHTAPSQPLPSMPQATAAPAPAPVAAPVPVTHEAAPEAAPRVPRPVPQADPTQCYLTKALAMAIKQGASDLHVHSGAPLMIRLDGQLRPLSRSGPMKRDAAERVIAEIMTDAQWDTLCADGEVDFAFEVPRLSRFRVNVYRQQRGLDVVFRIVPLRPPTLEQLGLPATLASLTDYRTGMVLCTGPAGCGKSTTLAALINMLIGQRSDHILTIENPVEFVYPPGRALVNQRQVGNHTQSFSRALRAALREDPDIIAITELRDQETISLAISAAETGHLVLGTLHTENAGQTISRIINSFPAEEQEQIRAMLAESLRAVVSQRLVPRSSGRGRVVAHELMLVNTAVSNLIREDKTYQLPSIMQTGRAAGMVNLDDSLEALVKNGSVEKAEARRFAVRKERFA
ncbi:MAG: PilT/PilU family type 4a pilus ATPase [Myxococcales bacterium]|nr:PilT/PilU family type 4a pilus ATPase [Myxococcales bacterium]